MGRLVKIIVFMWILPSMMYAQSDHSTLAEMQAKCRYQNRMVGDTIALPNSVLIDMLNEAVKATDDKLRPNMAFDTIWTDNGVSTYSLNSDCYPNAVISVRILEDSLTNIYQVAKRVGQDDQGQYNLSATGVPMWYSTHGQYISFLPSPPQKYRVEIEYEARSRMYNDTLASDTLLALKPEYEQLVVDYVSYLVLRRFNMDFTPVLGQWKESIAEERALIQKRPITTLREQGKP